MLEARDVQKTFGRKTVLQDIRLTLDHQVYGLLGANGAGKTTLIRCLCGLYEPTRGSILYEGVPIAQAPGFRRNLGYLPQTFGMFKELTLYEMMDYFCALKGIEKEARERDIAWALEMVNLADRAKVRVGALSGGMVRRSGIAQTLLGEGDVLLLDEPTAGLDPEERARFKTVVAQVKNRRTILISTHIVEDIEASCEQVIVLHEGRIRYEGSCQALRERAQGRVYLLSESEADHLPQPYFLLKTMETVDGIRARVLAAPGAAGRPVSPTLEDGYMALIKEIP